jgi:hypothetical protein
LVVKANNIMEKKAIKNKAVKKEKIENKDLPENVEVIGMKGNTLKEGQVYPVTRATAILLINKGFAKLK